MLLLLLTQPQRATHRGARGEPRGSANYMHSFALLAQAAIVRLIVCEIATCLLFSIFSVCCAGWNLITRRNKAREFRHQVDGSLLCWGDSQAVRT